MCKREKELYLLDIFIAIDKIKRYSKYFNNYQDFLYSDLEWDATIRELEIIGEATNELLKMEVLGREHRKIVDFRNTIIHGYFGIKEDIVWEVIKSKIPKLKFDLLEVVSENNIDLNEVIEKNLTDKKISKKTIFFLNELKSEVFDIIDEKNQSFSM